MRYCDCGAPIPRRKQKGGREREYCSHACQQRAYRQRHKGRLDIERLKREAEARVWANIWAKMDQDMHRETWQDELENNNNLIKNLLEEVQELTMGIEALENEIAEKDAEIIRLNALLDWHSKKKKPWTMPGPSAIVTSR